MCGAERALHGLTSQAAHVFIEIIFLKTSCLLFRSFLKVVVLIGETQERERVLQQFSCRFHQCNPNSFSSPGKPQALLR